MGEGGRKDSGGNNQQTIEAETNFHGVDLHEADKNERTQKTVGGVLQSPVQSLWFFFGDTSREGLRQVYDGRSSIQIIGNDYWGPLNQKRGERSAGYGFTIA